MPLLLLPPPTFRCGRYGLSSLRLGLVLTLAWPVLLWPRRRVVVVVVCAGCASCTFYSFQKVTKMSIALVMCGQPHDTTAATPTPNGIE